MKVETNITGYDKIIVNESEHGDMFVVTEDYDIGLYTEIPVGTVVVNIQGNLLAFQPNDFIRVWSEEAALLQSTIVNHLKLRPAKPGEGVTITA